MSIITVSKRQDLGEKRTHLTSSWTAGGKSWAAVFHIKNRRKEVYEYSALFALWRPLISLLSMAGWARGPLICAVGTPGYRLDQLAAVECDCLIGCPLKAMKSYCALACQCWACPEASPLGRRSPVFSFSPQRTLPHAGPKT